MKKHGLFDIEQKHWEIIAAILKKYAYQFYAFGSRTKNTAKQFSDFDLCYKEAIPDTIIAQIEGELEQSDLPFKVEFVSWNRCDDAFKKQIEPDLVPLPEFQQQNS
jgi:hypothetical protein